MTNRKGTLIVLSGPSGTGKGTVLKHFFDNYADDAVKLSISATTRLPRNGETDGVNYFFVEKEKFERHLRGTNLSENTISSYMFAIKQYGEQYDDVTQKKLREYKVWLIENYKPKTVNLRLRAINCYLECIGKEKWKLPFVRVQQKGSLWSAFNRNHFWKM